MSNNETKQEAPKNEPPKETKQEPPKQEVKAESRKKQIKVSVRGSQQAKMYPDIRAGICEFCGHPPYKCPSCGTAQKQLPINKDGECLWPSHCVNNRCMKELPVEAIDALAFCIHYADLRHEIACIYCKDRKALFYRKNQVRAIVQADGSEQLVIICSDINCRIAFQKEFAPERKIA